MLKTADYISFHAKLNPDSLAVVELSSGRQWSYLEFDIAVAKCCSVLKKNKVKAGDRVTVLSKNNAEYVMLFFACMRIGAIFVPLNWRLTPTELSYLISDVEPKMLIGDDCLKYANLAGTVISDIIEQISTADVFESITDEINIDSPALILFTSGTSGKPKGALLSKRNIEQTCINASLLCEVTKSSVYLCDAPFFHVIGLVANVCTAIMRGASFYISDGFSPSKTLNNLYDTRLAITHYFCVPQMAQALRTEQSFEPSKLNNLVAIFTGGAPNPSADINAWLEDGILAVDGYGSSEAGTVFGMPINKSFIAQHAGAVGFAAPDMKALIVDENGTECVVGQPGELLLKGDNIIAGYWGRARESDSAFTADGWFATGDIARVDQDGCYWIIGRSKDMYISGGENVYPAEIEHCLASHPLVKESAVVGVADERWGEVGHLYIVLKNDKDKPNTEVVLAFLTEQLAKYKVPKYISYIKALPKNATGKILKKALAKNNKPEY